MLFKKHNPCICDRACGSAVHLSSACNGVWQLRCASATGLFLHLVLFFVLQRYLHVCLCSIPACKTQSLNETEREVENKNSLKLQHLEDYFYLNYLLFLPKLSLSASGIHVFVC